MRESKFSTFFVLTVFLFGSIVAFAHSVKTAANDCTVNHYDNLGYCLPWYPYDCPVSDSTFESDYGFSSSDRVLSGTYNFNCHGRTFDNRGCWIDYADQYINCDGPYSPYNPGYGDAIIWFYSDGTTMHSATIISSWNGTSTTIKSKYGKQGEYWHSLADCISAYGSNWTVTRFSAGTTVYSLGLSQERFENSKKKVMEKLLAERKKMPWYQDVLESEEIFEIRGKEIVERITSLSSDSRRMYEKATSTDNKIEILFYDFLDSRHYQYLGIFNSPEFSTDYIHGIEAGNLLVEISSNQSEFRGIIANRFKELLNSEDLGEYSDQKKGAIISPLGRILDGKQQFELINSLNKINYSKPKEKLTDVPTYVEYYLEQLLITMSEVKEKRDLEDPSKK
jgi:hypothetical protein